MFFKNRLDFSASTTALASRRRISYCAMPGSEDCPILEKRLAGVVIFVTSTTESVMNVPTQSRNGYSLAYPGTTEA